MEYEKSTLYHIKEKYFIYWQHNNPIHHWLWSSWQIYHRHTSLIILSTLWIYHAYVYVHVHLLHLPLSFPHQIYNPRSPWDVDKILAILIQIKIHTHGAIFYAVPARLWNSGNVFVTWISFSHPHGNDV